MHQLHRTTESRKRRRCGTFLSPSYIILYAAVILVFDGNHHPTEASSKRPPSNSNNNNQWSSTYLGDSAINNPFYFSEDESEERIIDSLAKIDQSSSLSSSSSSEKEEHKKARNKADLYPNKTTRRRRVRKKKRKVKYPSIPETYRVKGTTTPSTTLEASPKSTSPTSLPAATEKQSPPLQQASALPTNSTPWIHQFLTDAQRDVLLPLPLDFLLDNFNFAQLAPVIERIGNDALTDEERLQLMQTKQHNKTGYSIYKQALQLLKQQEPVSPENIPLYLETATRALYLLLHQRFCQSPRGLDMVRRRFLFIGPTLFDKCPTLTCHGMPLLPYGASENYQMIVKRNNHNTDSTNEEDTETAFQFCQRYCCQCGQVFFHWTSKVDACAWGPSFCHLFVMTFGKQFLLEQTEMASQRLIFSERGTYKNRLDPTIFGFHLHPSTGQ